MIKKGEAVSARQQMHLSFISDFTTRIVHVSGKQNVVADALSRVFNVIHPAVSPRLFHKAQERDPETPLVKTSITGLRLGVVEFEPGIHLLCDLSLPHPRPWVSESLRSTVFDSIHATSHPGIRAGKRLISLNFVWHGLNRDVAHWTRNCLACQQAKVTRHTWAPIMPMEIPSDRFSVIYLDIAGPLEPSQGHRHLLTLIDRFSRSTNRQIKDSLGARLAGSQWFHHLP